MRTLPLLHTVYAIRSRDTNRFLFCSVPKKLDNTAPCKLSYKSTAVLFVLIPASTLEDFAYGADVKLFPSI